MTPLPTTLEIEVIATVTGNHPAVSASYPSVADTLVLERCRLDPQPATGPLPIARTRPAAIHLVTTPGLTLRSWPNAGVVSQSSGALTT